MPPCTEVLTFITSDAYRNDPKAVLTKASEILHTKAGMLSTYHGLQVEDVSNGYLFVNWETYEDHKKVMDAPDYKELVDSLKPAFGGAFEMVHANFNTDPTPLFDSPVVEMAFATLKPGITVDAVSESFDKIQAWKAEGFLGATWGPTVEKSDVLVAVIAWESIEAHHEVFENLPESDKAAVGTLIEKVTQTTAHVKLIKA